MDAEFYQNARRWLNAGNNFVPIKPGEGKAPSKSMLPNGLWKPYQERRTTLEELKSWLKQGAGLGIVAGKISGNLLIIDFDEPDLHLVFMEVLKEDYPTLSSLIPMVLTPSGGGHLYIRCTQHVKGNEILAKCKDKKARIETRGEGGQALAPGCPPACHEANKTYTILQGDLTDIPIVEPDVLETILQMARAFDESPPEEKQIVREPKTANLNGHKRPGDEFNQRGQFADFLLKHGWKRCGSRGQKQLWKRPGKEAKGISATENYADTGLFYVFSSNAYPFESNRAYPPFSVYTILEHNGDFSAAARALDKQGYGDPAPRLRAATKHAQRVEEEETDDTHYPLTDSGNAERFVRDWKGEIRYCDELGKWFIWENGKWAINGSGCAMRLALKTVRKIYSESEHIDDLKARRDTSKWAMSSENANKIRAMVDLAKNNSKLAIRTNQLDAQHWLLNVANGIINLNTGQLYDHDPNAYLTRQVPIDYDPEATAPLWEAFLERVIPDKDVRDFARRVVGYTLTGDISEQCLFFLHGKGRNGKSTFIEMISTLLGEYWTKTSSKTVMVKRNDNAPTNDLAALRGCRLVTGSEIGDGQRIDEALVKDMTGGDSISARFLYAESFTFRPVFKLYLYGNHKPQIRQTDEGIWRRMRLVPFEVKIPESEQDKHLREKMNNELPGILAWAVRGCLEWQEVGLAAPSIVTRATAEYREEMDTLAPFFTECCTFKAEGRCDKTDLWRTYKEWSEKNEEKVFENARNFNHCVSGHEGIKEDRYGGRRIWIGIEIGHEKSLLDDNESQEKSGSGSNNGSCDSLEANPINLSPIIPHVTDLMEKGSHESHESHEAQNENLEIFEVEIK